jgi:GNAT superfamily N-acetyltransferase
MKFIQAESADDIQRTRELFEQYAAWLEIDMCFQNFDHELATLPGHYAPPNGRLLLALEADELAGCVALRKINADMCEMKRLFLRPAFRGRGLGRELAAAIIAAAREIGYQFMRLDTLPGKMDQAIMIYRSMGFQEIQAYYESPVVGTKFMELALSNSAKRTRPTS